jgi:hypothetical protein
MAAIGKGGKSNVMVYDDAITAPSGRPTSNGVAAICCSLQGALEIMKCPVYYESKMAVDLEWEGEGGTVDIVHKVLATR